MIDLRKMRLAEHVVCTVKMRIAYKILEENLEEENRLDHLGMDGRPVLIHMS
jgi:hypothetical protein